MTAQPALAEDPPILLEERSAGLATLTLNRPDKFNALSEELLDALQSALEAIGADPDVHVVVLAANGRAFCAGHDLKQMRARPDEAYYQRLFAQCSRMMLTLRNIPQPVIAKVRGIATAAGCQLVAACDLAIASDDSRFATSGIDVGLFCSTPSVALARNVSRKRAFEMLITGQFVDAATAADYGLINRAVPAEALDREVDELAGKILAKAPVAVRTGKEMFYRQIEMGLDEAYIYAGGVMACNMMAEDTGEGLDAFIEKRPPRWKS